jgi:hypothetical protein
VAVSTLAVPQEIGPDWLSPSNTRNYIKGDPILDWLDYYGVRQDDESGGWANKRDFFHGYYPDNYDKSYIRETDFAKFIIAKGNQFELGVTRLISRILEDAHLPEIKRVALTLPDIRDFNSVRQTFNLMDEGFPVIHQPVLWAEELKIFGCPDLLVRADFLNSIIPGSIPEDRATVSATALSGDWHYVVVDIKFTSIEFNAAGEVANSKDHQKVQVALYNAALTQLQGYASPYGFLIGRTWKDHKKNRGDSCLQRIGRFSIHQPQHNKPPTNWVDAARPALTWLRKMRAEGHNWHAKSGMEIAEMRPNMGNTQDAPYHQAKKLIAEETGELTKLWSVGIPKRNAFIETEKCDDWRNPACTAARLGLTGATAKRLENILWVNQTSDASVAPARIEWSRDEWAIAQPAEFFVDFETCNDLNDDFKSLPTKGGQALIFMIGCGHIENGEWRFKCFTADELSPECELKVIQSWMIHMDAVTARLTHGKPMSVAQESLFDLASERPMRPQVFHWSPAEKNTLIEAYDSAEVRHGSAIERPNFYDFLNRVVKPSGDAGCFAVRGAFNFGLKSIGKALQSLGLIQTEWTDGPTDGLGAMTGSWWCYEQSAIKGTPVLEVETLGGRKLFQEITRYNEIDCKVMYEAIDYLRRCH